MDKTENYKKLIVVRHPLERLISAYLAKIYEEKVDYPKAPYQAEVLPFVKKHRKNAKNTDITFEEFMLFVTNSSKGRNNEHWKPYDSLCHPCDMQYDIIGKLETIEEDSERFLRMIGAPEQLHYPYRKKRVQTPVYESYKKNVTSEIKIGLLKYYGVDFDMFGYEFPTFD